MSTDDVVTIADKPCPCGGGRLLAYSVTPDHPWARASQETWKASIDCPACEEAYELVEQQGEYRERVPLILASAVELAERRAKTKKWHADSKALMKSLPVRQVLKSFIATLEGEKSVAAAFRFLGRYQLAVESIGTFRKRFRKGEEAAWVKHYIIYSNLPKVLEALGLDDIIIEQAITNIDTLWDEAHAPLSPIGDPLANVRQSSPPLWSA